MDRICADHKVLNQANVMGLSKSGTLAAMASSRCVGLVNLDQPETLLCKQKRVFKEVNELQFSKGSESLIAIATGMKVDTPSLFYKKRSKNVSTSLDFAFFFFCTYSCFFKMYFGISEIKQILRRSQKRSF